MTNHLHWPTNTSITIRKGAMEVTLGQTKKETPKAVVVVPPPPPTAPRKPLSVQGTVFVTVLLVLLCMAIAYGWSRLARLQEKRFKNSTW